MHFITTTVFVFNDNFAVPKFGHAFLG